MNKNKINFKNIIIWVFISVPILSSIISTFHLITFFAIGNTALMSFLLALVFELGSISSFLVLSVLPDVNKWMLWSVFIGLALLQIVGNVFYTFNFIQMSLMTNPNWMSSIISFLTYFGLGNMESQIFISMVMGVPIPLISLFFLKSTSNYIDQKKIYNKEEHNEDLKTNIEQTAIEEIKTEIPIVKSVHPDNVLSEDNDFLKDNVQ